MAILAFAGAFACTQKRDPAKLLQRAIAAQGGRARLSALDNLAVVSEGVFKEQVALKRKLFWRAPGTWAMTISSNGVTMMTYGVDGKRCWTKNRQFVAACSDGDRREYARITDVFHARFLHGLDAAKLSSAADVDLGGQASPSLRAGDLQLVFDAKSNLLKQVRYDGDWVETFSEFRSVDHVQVGARRELVIGGKPDVTETWTEIRPGGATAADLAAPAASAAGQVVDELDPARAVAWTEVPSVNDITGKVRERLQRFASAHGFQTSSIDGLVVEPVDDPTAPQRWRLAITLEAGKPVASLTEGDLHLDTWPPEQILGVFVEGGIAATFEHKSELATALDKRHVVAKAGARYAAICPGDCLLRPQTHRLVLLRVAVEPHPR